MMAHFLDSLITAILPTVVAQTSGTELVSNLLTGGGFAFLSALMGGLLLYTKNQSESSAVINKASQEFVEGARIEVAAVSAELKAAADEAKTAKLQFSATRRELDDLQETYESERHRWRRWMTRQRLANDAHHLWDIELKTQLEQLGGTIGEVPPLATYSPDDPDYPLRPQGSM